MLRLLTTIILNIIITLSLFYVFIFSKVSLIEEWVHTKKNINSNQSKIILSYNSILEWDINLDKWEIILKENAQLQWNIYLREGNIRIDKNAEVFWDIEINWEIILWENVKINGNISEYSALKKHSTASVTWNKPNLYITTDYPEFLKYFDVLPERHKQSFWYIFLTSHNMDIRWVELQAEKYFKSIFVYKNNKLTKIDKTTNPELLKKLYKKSSEYVNILPERKISRFWVAFVTKTYAQDKNFADMYISSASADSLLFMHESWHVLDYKNAFIDYHNPIYPYPNKDSAITEYGKFHKWEDFAEAYRYYVLHNDSFKKKASSNKDIQDKYDYLKQYVFEGKEYN
jgi:hypothetical protein